MVIERDIKGPIWKSATASVHLFPQIYNGNEFGIKTAQLLEFEVNRLLTNVLTQMFTLRWVKYTYISKYILCMHVYYLGTVDNDKLSAVLSIDSELH